MQAVSSYSRVWAGAKRLFTYLVLCLGAAVMLLPFFWMISTSFKPFSETFIVPIKWLPQSPTFDNYVTVFGRMNFLSYYKNTIIVAVSLTVLQLFFASLAAYAFARLTFPGRNVIFFALLTVFMVPGQMTLIPKYLMVQSLGWIDSYAALIVPGMFSVYATFFMRQYFMNLPKELEDAAKIDGCSYFYTYARIMLPLCTNALIALGIFSILSAWNDMVWPLLVTSTDQKRVLSIALAALQGQYATRNNLLMAASVVSILPMLVIFAFGQKHIISGIAVSGIKG